MELHQIIRLNDVNSVRIIFSFMIILVSCEQIRADFDVDMRSKLEYVKNNLPTGSIVYQIATVPNPQVPCVWDALKILKGSKSTDDSYPQLADIPSTNFNCGGVSQAGFYADQQTGCQVVRRCDLDGGLSSYLCPNQTIFNQITLICDWWYNVDCSLSAQFQNYSNPRLYHPTWVLLDDCSDNGYSTGSATVTTSKYVTVPTDTTRITTESAQTYSTKMSTRKYNTNTKTTAVYPTVTKTTSTSKSSRTYPTQTQTTKKYLTDTTVKTSGAYPTVTTTVSTTKTYPTITKTVGTTKSTRLYPTVITSKKHTAKVYSTTQTTTELTPESFTTDYETDSTQTSSPSTIYASATYPQDTTTKYVTTTPTKTTTKYVTTAKPYPGTTKKATKATTEYPSDDNDDSTTKTYTIKHKKSTKYQTEPPENEDYDSQGPSNGGDGGTVVFQGGIDDSVITINNRKKIEPFPNTTAEGATREDDQAGDKSS